MQHVTTVGGSVLDLDDDNIARGTVHDDGSAEVVNLAGMCSSWKEWATISWP